MADKNDRPSAEYSITGAAKPEKLAGVPRLGPLVAGKVQAPKPNVPPPPPPKPRLADMRPVHASRNERTLVGPAAPPGAGNKVPPVPLPAPELDSTLESPEPPRSLSPTPWERDSVVDAVEAEVSRHGDRLVRRQDPAEITPVPSSAPSKEKSPLMRRLAIIAAFFTGASGVVTAIGNAVVQVIEAQRPPTVAALKERIEELEKARNAGYGLPLESEARRKADAEHTNSIIKLDARLKQLEPRDTIQGLAPPK
jgi:hypothetical protein